jgi:hypothetical protein
MTTSKDELAKALEALASGKEDARHSQQQEQGDVPDQAHQAPMLADRMSHSIRPLPGKPGVPAMATHDRPRANRSIWLRQTAIPPLLTLGVLMSLTGIASLIMGEESPLGEQLLLPILMILLGLLTLAAAALNMRQVRHLVSAARR